MHSETIRWILNAFHFFFFQLNYSIIYLPTVSLGEL